MSGSDADLLLPRWRRLDWRFLLPAIAPDRVACAGALDEALLQALPLLAPTVLTVRTPGDWSALTGSCDLVVLIRPQPADLAGAVATLRPGGWVYAEVRRELGGRAPRTLAGWRRRFARAGLEEVTAHWHAPGFEACSRIISVDARAVVRDALGRHEAVRFGAVVSAVGRLALRLGLFPLAVPEGSVIGRRPEGSAR